MKTGLAVSLASLFLITSIASAQQPPAKKAASSTLTAPQTTQPAAEHFTAPSLSAPPVTPELWVYSQERQRHDDPAQAVRRKAELKADQRLARLAALKWYGQSNSRPEASPIPFMGAYSPAWVGSTWNRYEWPAYSTSSVILWSDEFNVRR
jgi:hypothetical protein